MRPGSSGTEPSLVTVLAAPPHLWADSDYFTQPHTPTPKYPCIPGVSRRNFAEDCGFVPPRPRPPTWFEGLPPLERECTAGRRSARLPASMLRRDRTLTHPFGGPPRLPRDRETGDCGVASDLLSAIPTDDRRGALPSPLQRWWIAAEGDDHGNREFTASTGVDGPFPPVASQALQGVGPGRVCQLVVSRHDIRDMTEGTWKQELARLGRSWSASRRPPRGLDPVAKTLRPLAMDVAGASRRREQHRVARESCGVRRLGDHGSHVNELIARSIRFLRTATSVSRPAHRICSCDREERPLTRARSSREGDLSYRRFTPARP